MASMHASSQPCSRICSALWRARSQCTPLIKARSSSGFLMWIFIATLRMRYQTVRPAAALTPTLRVHRATSVAAHRPGYSWLAWFSGGFAVASALDGQNPIPAFCGWPRCRCVCAATPHAAAKRNEIAATIHDAFGVLPNVAEIFQSLLQVGNLVPQRCSRLRDFLADVLAGCRQKVLL